LTNVGGPIRTTGDRDAARRLAHALAVAPAGDGDADRTRPHVHGFHTYPARLHPDTAARLIQAFVPPAGRVLDPFCGSGTVLVEAVFQGCPALGVDLNPLAVRLAHGKTRPRGPDELPRLVERAGAIARRAGAKRLSRAGAAHPFPREDVRLFEPHVLHELDSLRAGIADVRDELLRDDLSLVLSAILVKLSRQRGDTGRAGATRRTAPGFAARTFAAKAEDLARRLGELSARMPRPAPAVLVALGDATELAGIPSGGADAIITSPPYAGTYDYLEHHELRMRWLGLDAAPLSRGEFGARSRYAGLTPADARPAWSRELARFLQSAGRVLPNGGPVVLVMADSAVAGVALRADEIVAAVAHECGFRPVACASQARPHFHGPTATAFRDRPRAEHAILLQKMENVLPPIRARGTSAAHKKSATSPSSFLPIRGTIAPGAG
jgi:SAM-dependent methyltransferase